jgi:hypothetical protein
MLIRVLPCCAIGLSAGLLSPVPAQSVDEFPDDFLRYRIGELVHVDPRNGWLLPPLASCDL